MIGGYWLTVTWNTGDGQGVTRASFIPSTEELMEEINKVLINDPGVKSDIRSIDIQPVEGE